MPTTARISGKVPIPLSIFRNSDNTISVEVVDTDGTTVFDLTGCSIAFTARWFYSDSAASLAIELTSADPAEIVVTNAADGTFNLLFDPDSTSSLPIASVDLLYDLVITDGSSQVFTALHGVLTIFPNITP